MTAGQPRIPGDPDADRHWLEAAIELSRRCSTSDSAFSVGAILVCASGRVIATGFSRETSPTDHAEEVAVRRATAGAGGATALAGPDIAASGGVDLGDATLYSSLEPCVARASRPVTCAELILAAGIRRVVIAWREPPVFVPGGGAAWLTSRGVTIIEFPDLAAPARSVNHHLRTR